ncbi:DUF4112 domain-containing protein [Gluconobacter oxydans]|uniref:DUF4112 domain-containing protein n=1 Tax=Gluconobacter oxydans TaxID=442 RepID=UPI001CD85765|nr:DUF4112 domain-containing protein [Gluconobacter oxydans]
MTDFSTISPPVSVAELRVRLDRIRRLAWLLNSAARIPGLRLRAGLDTLLGLLPGGGALIGTALSLYIVWEGRRMGVDRQTVQRMLGNVAIEAVVGLVPLAGDLFDTVFKADLRNIALIEAALAGRLGVQ